MAYNGLHKLNANIDAIEIALGWQQGGTLSGADIERLKDFSGFGGIKAILFPEGSKQQWADSGASDEDMKLHDDIMRLYDLLAARYPIHTIRINGT